MASPVVAGTAESSTNTAGTSHVLNWTGLGTVSAGDLLIIILDKGSTAATVNAHADWTELLDENLGNGLYIAYRWATGGETAPTLTTSASTRSAEITYRITGAANPALQAPQIGTTATGTSATPDPPASATPGSTKDYLFIALAGMAGEEADDDTWGNTPPTNYTPNPPRQKSCGTAGTNLGGLILAAERALNTGSAENPGTFGVDVSAAWRSQTIMVHPTFDVALDADANVITLSAPTVPAVDLTMPQTTNTVTVSAPDIPAVHLTAPAWTKKTFTDEFTEVSSVQLPTHNANWSLLSGTMLAESNQLRNDLNTGPNTAAAYTGQTFLSDHYSKVTLSSTANDSFIGVLVRGQTGAATYYAYIANSNSSKLIRSVSGTVTTLQTGSGLSSSAVLELRAFGSVLSARVNGQLKHQVVDTTISGGSPGVAGEVVSKSVSADNWEGGNNESPTIVIVAPTASLIQGVVLAAGQNTITVSAPAQSQLIATTLAAGQNTITVTAPTASLIQDVVLAAGQNTVTVTAPTVEAVHLTVPATTNTITVTAPVVPSMVLTVPATANTVTVTAPTIPAINLTMPQDTNTVTVSAPAQSQLAEVTVAAGQNTVTLSAPTAGIDAPAGGDTLAAGQNTITLSAPAQSQLAEVTVAAGQNTVTLSAPEETLLAEITLSASANIVTLSAPANTLLAETTLAAGQNTVTLSAPEETLLAEVTLAAGQNTVTLSAPTVPAVHLTMPQTANVITLTAPAAEIIQAGNLLADANVITLSAPTVPAVHLTMPQTTNTVTVTAPTATVNVVVETTANTVNVTAPTATMQVDALASAGVNIVTVTAPVATLLSLDQYVAATANTVTVSAPVLAGVHLTHVVETNTVTVTAPTATRTATFDSILAAGSATINVRAPILTVQHQYLGTAIYRETALIQVTQHETIKV